MQPLVISLCVIVGLVLIVRSSIRQLRTLPVAASGPWRWVGIIWLGSLVLASGVYLVVGGIGFLSQTIE